MTRDIHTCPSIGQGTILHTPRYRLRGRSRAGRYMRSGESDIQEGRCRRCAKLVAGPVNEVPRGGDRSAVVFTLLNDVLTISFVALSKLNAPPRSMAWGRR